MRLRGGKKGGVGEEPRLDWSLNAPKDFLEERSQ